MTWVNNIHVNLKDVKKKRTKVPFVSAAAFIVCKHSSFVFVVLKRDFDLCRIHNRIFCQSSQSPNSTAPLNQKPISKMDILLFIKKQKQKLVTQKVLYPSSPPFTAPPHSLIRSAGPFVRSNMQRFTPFCGKLKKRKKENSQTNY